MAKKCARSCHRYSTEIDQAQIGLVHERRRLQCVSGVLPAHVAPCQPVQLDPNQRDQPVESGVVSPLSREQQIGDGF